MILVHKNGMQYFQFPGLSQLKGLFHGIMTCDADNNGSRRLFNLGLNCGEPLETVWANRRRMTAAFNANFTVFARQVHGDRVAIWPDHRSDSRHTDAYAYLHGDALATAEIGHALVIQTADCQSVLLVDPGKRVVANVHSGWRGSVQNVVAQTVSAMKHRWACQSENILCAIGPSLGPCCAEFIHFRQELPPHLWDYQCDDNHFDFWQITVDQLKAAGVGQDHIEVSRICTKCNQHLFFSHRGRRHTGRFAALIGWGI